MAEYKCSNETKAFQPRCEGPRSRGDEGGPRPALSLLQPPPTTNQPMQRCCSPPPDNSKNRKLLLRGFLRPCLHPDVISLVLDYMASIELNLCQSVVLSQDYPLHMPISLGWWENQIFVAGSRDNSISCFHQVTGKFLTELKFSSSNKALYAASLAVQMVGDQDAELFIVAGDRNRGPRQIIVWNLDLLQQVRQWPSRARSICVDSSEPKELYCSTLDSTISIVSPESGKVLRTFGRDGTAGRPSGDDYVPWGLAVDGEELFIADRDNHCVTVMDKLHGHIIKRCKPRIDLSSWPEFDRPEGIVVHGNELVIADTYHHRVAILDREEGSLLRSFGIRGSNASDLSYPCDLVLDGGSRLYVCDFGNSRIQVFE